MANDYGWSFISVTDILRDALRSQNLPIVRENLRSLSALWRRKSGFGVLVNKAVAIYEKDQKKHKGLVLASLRNPGEVDRVHELGGKVVWVDANPRLRYNRIQANATSRSRTGEDSKTYKQFLAEEQAEMEHSGDETTLSLSGVKAKADIFIENNGSLEEFKKHIQKALEL